MKKGGTTANTNVGSKPMKPRFNCKHCGRSYGQQWTKEKHERSCL